MKSTKYLILIFGLILVVFMVFGIRKGANDPAVEIILTPAPVEKVLVKSPSLTPVPSFSTTPKSPPSITAKKVDVLQNVPFVVQAPRHNWADPVYQNACEEATILMAMRWVEGKDLTKDEAFIEIQKISDFSKAHYGFYLDQSAEDLAKLMQEYFNYSNVSYKENITTADIKDELFKGNLVLVPVNGQKLGNPYFTPPGPTEHMLLIKGFDVKTNEFITNDSGVGKGNGYRYKEKVLFEAIRKYPSGFKEKIKKIEKVMIVVSK